MLVRGNIIRYSGDSQLYEIIRIETDCLRVRRLRDGRTNYLDERDCSFVQERKFQVGDLVRATCRSGDPYTTTSEGWIGKVIEVREGSDTDIVVESLVLNPSEEQTHHSSHSATVKMTNGDILTVSLMKKK